MILMYHHISPPDLVPHNALPMEGWQFLHSPQSFERQLRNLMKRGYKFVSMEEYIDGIRVSGRECANTAVVTFDDGWVDNYTHALPVLKEMEIPATFFCTTGHLHRGESDESKMNVNQLRELLASGMTIGGHTRTHAILTLLSAEQAREEIEGSKVDLEDVLGIDVKFFAYPGGAFNRDVARITQEAGYTAACSVIGPAANDRSSIFWLYRDVLSEDMNSWADRYRLSPIARRLLSFRVRRRLSESLGKP